MAAKAVIFGCEGLTLTEAEKAFFREQQPLGFILFARNCDSPDQIKALIEYLKACVSHEDVLVLIDQEGGRVQRLGPPTWRKYPPADLFVRLARQNAAKAQEACTLNARLMAEDLRALGINTDCAPVADLRLPQAHEIIGDRAFGADAQSIVPLARAQVDGLKAGGVLPVLKHIPGHGRAMVDSHEDLPVVEADLATLQADFEPFRKLADLPMAMTAHIRYTAIDANNPATLSTQVINLIRDDIAFDGLLMSDDISMKALQGDIGERSAAAIAAGCDIVLHCNGKMEEMQAIAASVGELSAASQARVDRVFEWLDPVQPVDITQLESRWAELLEGSKAA